MKNEEIYLGLLRSEGVLESPRLEIDLSKTINITGDYNWIVEGELHRDLSGKYKSITFFVDVDYSEKTRMKDTPRFHLILKDENGKWLNSSSISSRDTPGPTDHLDSKLRVYFPLYLLENVDNYSFSIDLFVKLDRDSWSTNQQDPYDLWKRANISCEFTLDETFEIGPPDEGDYYFKDKSYLLGVRNVSEHELDVDLFPELLSQRSYLLKYFPERINYFMGWGKIPWNTLYYVLIRINLPKYDYPIKCECRAYEFDESEGPPPRYVPKYGLELEGFRVDKYFFPTDPAQRNEFFHVLRQLAIWSWYAKSDPIRLTGPYRKNVRFYVNVFPKDNPRNLLEEHVMSIDIFVPKEKIKAIRRLSMLQTSKRDFDLFSKIFAAILAILIIVGAAATFGGSFIGPFIALFGGFVVKPILVENINLTSDYASKKCALVFCEDYQELDVFKASTDISNEIPEEYAKFLLYIGNIIKLNKLMDSTYQKLMSALRENELSTVEAHYRNAEDFQRLIEFYTLYIQKEKNDYLDSLTAEELILEEDILQKIQEIKENGFPESLKSKLEEYGFKTEEINEFEENRIGEIPDQNEDLNNMVLNFVGSLRELVESAINSYFFSLEIIKIIREVMTLKGSDILMSLFNNGLITIEEYNERVLKVGINHSIFQLRIFAFAQLRDLEQMGILTTYDFLYRNRTRSKRKKFEKETRFKAKKILWLINIIDLLRIPGMTEEFAIRLESSGVDTAKELSNRNPNNLREKLLADHEGIEIELSQVEEWIENAKNLEKIIKY